MEIIINGNKETFAITPSALRRLKTFGWTPESMPELAEKNMSVLERLDQIINLLWCMAPADVREAYPSADDAFADALGIEIVSTLFLQALANELASATAQIATASAPNVQPRRPRAKR